MTPDFFNRKAPIPAPQAYNACMEAWNRSFQASRVDRGKPIDARAGSGPAAAPR